MADANGPIRVGKFAPIRLECSRNHQLHITKATLFPITLWASIGTLGLVCLLGACNNLDETKYFQDECNWKDRKCEFTPTGGLNFNTDRRIGIEYECRPCSSLHSIQNYCLQYLIDSEKVKKIENYFHSRIVVQKNSTDIEYCFPNNNNNNNRIKREKPPMSMDELIDIYRHLYNADVIDYTPNSNSPITNIGTLRVDVNELEQSQRIPTFLTATIRRVHLPTTSHPNNYPADVERQMSIMGGLLDTDDRGHLLAHSLGGSSTCLNMIPMARRLNRHFLPENKEFKEELRLDRIPLSLWRSNEAYIRLFLDRNPNGRVEWRLALQYQEDVYFGGVENLRPTHVSTQFTAYRGDGTVYFSSDEVCFVNDESFQCGWIVMSRAAKPTLLESKCSNVDVRRIALLSSCFLSKKHPAIIMSDYKNNKFVLRIIIILNLFFLNFECFYFIKIHRWRKIDYWSIGSLGFSATFDALKNQGSRMGNKSIVVEPQIRSRKEARLLARGFQSLSRVKRRYCKEFVIDDKIC